jgi:hypothetical protein
MKKFISHGLVCLVLILFFTHIAHADLTGGNCEPGKLCNPLSVGSSLADFLQAIVDKVILPIGSIAAVGAFIWTGFLFVVARGNESTLERAKRSLLYTSIGTALLLGAWTLATVVQTTVNQLGN